MSVSFTNIVMRRCANSLCGYSVFMVAPSTGANTDYCPQCLSPLVSARPDEMREPPVPTQEDPVPPVVGTPHPPRA